MLALEIEKQLAGEAKKCRSEGGRHKGVEHLVTEPLPGLGLIREVELPGPVRFGAGSEGSQRHRKKLEAV